MAARSMLLDLYQLSHGEFMSQWGIRGFDSTTEFLKLRTGARPVETILSGGEVTPNIIITLTDKVLTGLFITVIDQAAGACVATIIIAGPSGTFTYRITTVSGNMPSSLSLSGFEFPITTITINATSGSPLCAYTAFGYTPPTTNP